MIELKVTNELDRIVGRANHVFGPGENERVRVDALRLNEITDCPYLSATLVGADSVMEIPEDALRDLEVEYNATEAAVALAKKHRINPFSVEGTGRGGQVIVSDVEAYVGRGSAAETGNPTVGQAFTMDTQEIQDDAEDQAIDTIETHETPEDLDYIDGTEHPGRVHPGKAGYGAERDDS